MPKHLGILISPAGEEFYDAYGPMTKLRDRATRFATAAIAAQAANNRFGRHDAAFWNSERASRDRALTEHRGWTSRTEEVAADDAKREGHYLASYVEGQGEKDYLFAHDGGGGSVVWDTALQDCRLWDDRNDAVAFAHALPQPGGRRFAVASY